jgi:hypothetical protein
VVKVAHKTGLAVLRHLAVLCGGASGQDRFAEFCQRLSVCPDLTSAKPAPVKRGGHTHDLVRPVIFWSASAHKVYSCFARQTQCVLQHARPYQAGK